MTTIIEKNEDAFRRRYGISLQANWELISDDIREDALQKAILLEKTQLYDSLGFSKDEILRIVLGFTGKTSVENSLRNASPVLRFVLWEPDESLFEAYCTIYDISDIIEDQRLSIVLGNDNSNLKKVLSNNIFDYNVHHSKIMSVGRYVSNTDPRVLELTEILTELSRDVVMNPNARKAFGKLPCENLLYTIRSLNDNFVINQLFECIPVRNIPVIIVSAGPSLVKNYKLLNKAKGKSLIVAVSHSLKTLNDGNIVPDLVAVTDPVKTDFINYNDNKNITLLSSVYADRECVKMYSGRVVYYGFNYFSDMFAIKRTTKEAFAEMDTGSVATDVFSLFLTAGFSTFILVGQDLAYGEDGCIYANDDSEDDEFEDIHEVVGINGEAVKTRDDWEKFRKYFENRILEDDKIQLIDATEGGALINGSIVMKLSDAIEKYCTKEYPVDEWLKNVYRMDRCSKEEKNYILQWFRGELSDVEIMKKKLNETIDLNESIRYRWNEMAAWNDEFKADCKRYDILYNVLLNGSAGLLLCNYCMDVIQKYVECALVLEGDENIISKLSLERDLFVYMESQAEELEKYIENLINGF